MSHRTASTVIEKIFTATTYEVDAVTWDPYLTLIPEMGISQLQVYYRTTGTTEWAFVTKASWSNTYNSSANTIDLTNATVTSSGSEIPATINATTHDIKLVRDTSESLFVSFKNGAKLDADDLNVVNLQAIHLIQELDNTVVVDDDNIYTYIAAQLANYYTKTEINNFFSSLTLPNWQADYPYVVGDTVLHDDPNTTETTLLIWYCGVDHTSETANQPTSGSNIWTNVAPDSSLDNLQYIRKIPGLDATELNWNTIIPQNANAPALVLTPHASQSVSMFKLTNSNQTTDLITMSLESANIGKLYLDRANLYVDNTSYLGHDGLSSTLFHYNGVTQGLTARPTIGIKQKSNSHALLVQDSGTTDNSNTANNIFTVGNLGTNLTKVWGDFKTTGTVTEISSPNIVFGSTSSKDCYGTFLSFGGGGPIDSPIRILRGVNVGTVDNCTNNAFTSRFTVFETTGNFTSAGDATITGTVTGGEFKDATLANATYLSADANGVISKETGSIPATNRLSLAITGSNTTLSDRDVVYLDNSSGLWTKSVASDPSKLSIGMIDDKTGSDGSQSFNVIFSGSVGGFSSLEVGNYCWLSGTGGITQTRPTSAGALVDPVGLAVSATTVYVLPARPHKEPT